jgi:hypothetical protein
VALKGRTSAGDASPQKRQATTPETILENAPTELKDVSDSMQEDKESASVPMDVDQSSLHQSCMSNSYWKPVIVHVVQDTNVPPLDVSALVNRDADTAHHTAHNTAHTNPDHVNPVVQSFCIHSDAGTSTEPTVPVAEPDDDPMNQGIRLEFSEVLDGTESGSQTTESKMTSSVGSSWLNVSTAAGYTRHHEGDAWKMANGNLPPS